MNVGPGGVCPDDLVGRFEVGPPPTGPGRPAPATVPKEEEEGVASEGEGAGAGRSRSASGTGEEMQLAGTWQLAVESKSRPRRPHRHTLRISREEGHWSVEYRTSRSEGEQARDVTLTGPELSFKVARGRHVAGFYRGTIAGDFISGSLEYIEGERVVGRREFSGARQTR